MQVPYLSYKKLPNLVLGWEVRMKPDTVVATEPIPPPAIVGGKDMCTVCGEQQAPNSSEGLCWVCRRLKISAWRDSDLQPSGQQE